MSLLDRLLPQPSFQMNNLPSIESFDPKSLSGYVTPDLSTPLSSEFSEKTPKPGITITRFFSNSLSIIASKVRRVAHALNRLCHLDTKLNNYWMTNWKLKQLSNPRCPVYAKIIPHLNEPRILCIFKTSLPNNNLPSYPSDGSSLSTVSYSREEDTLNKWITGLQDISNIKEGLVTIVTNGMKNNYTIDSIKDQISSRLNQIETDIDDLYTMDIEAARELFGIKNEY